MKLKKFGATEQKVYDLVKPVTDELGYFLWDVSYVKEGAMWYLRVFIDCDEGITIDDCEKVTEPVNAILDEAEVAHVYWGLLLDEATLRSLCRGLGALGDDVAPLDDGATLLALHAQDATGLTLVIAGDNHDGVTFLNV